MIRYRDRDGQLIYEEKDLDAMSARTGYSRQEILKKLRYRESELRKDGIANPVMPYFERDRDDPSIASGQKNRFLRLYFAGTPDERIKRILGINQQELEGLYRSQLGTEIKSSDSEVQKASQGKISPDFWREWDAVRIYLLSSGYNLQIPIVKMKTGL